MANIIKPLYDLIKGPTVLEWTTETSEAFIKSKLALTNSIMLVHPSTTSPLQITFNASDIAIGVAFEQETEGITKPIAFFSRKLNPAQTRYSTYDRELLAIIETIRHFRFFLEGRIVHVNTDHKLLIHALNSQAEKSPRQSRHLSYIAEFTNDIRHISGTSNHVADALSRITINGIEKLSEDIYAVLKLEQKNDEEVLYFIKKHPNTTEIRNYIYCETSRDLPRPIIPES